jgi:CBS domain-containing protein
MWRNDRDRPDDPRTRERETERLARDEYDRPRYGSPAGNYAHHPQNDWRAHAPPGYAPAGRDAQPAPRREPGIDDIRVHELMTRRVTSVHPATSVERAARLMEECDCGALPVIGDNGVLVGVITDRDIAIRIVARGRDARHAIVADCMSERVFACYANESVAECMRQMGHHQVRRMPIVDEHGRLVGIIAQGDLARHAGQHPAPHERRALAEVVSAVSRPSYMPYR